MRIASYFAAIALTTTPLAAQMPPVEAVKPSVADPRVKNFDEPNVIVRPANDMGTPPLAIFLPGTGGKVERLAGGMLRVVADQGYRVIGLYYNDVPAVQQVCPTVPDPTCAAKFREARIWGTGGLQQAVTPPEETINARLVALLRYLQRQHPGEHWDAYLTPMGEPVWSKIVVSGLSQGAGMAAFIAKREKVARVVCFSSPIDMIGGRRSGTELPAWLSAPSATPHERWYAERNSREPFNPGLIRSYPALGIPADHIRVFSLDLPPGKNASNPQIYHTININDPRYADEWRFLFGKASDIR